MILIPFYRIFHEIAAEETRCFHILEGEEDPEDPEEPSPPQGSYSLVELYCPDPNCDCRKANISITDEEGDECCSFQIGWEDAAFYDRHYGFDDHGLPGPSFAPMQFHSKYAFFFLDRLKELCARDKAYIARLERHYKMIKEAAKERDLFREVRKQIAESKTYRRSTNFPKRNDPCPCGSGKKYKKCCLYAIGEPLDFEK